MHVQAAVVERELATQGVLGQGLLVDRLAGLGQQASRMRPSDSVRLTSCPPTLATPRAGL